MPVIHHAKQSLRKPYCYYGEEFRVECLRVGKVHDARGVANDIARAGGARFSFVREETIIRVVAPHRRR